MKISVNNFPLSGIILGQTGISDDIIMSKNVIVPIGQDLFIDGGGGRDRIFDNAQGPSTITFHQDDRGYVGGNIGSICGYRGDSTQTVTILSLQDNENVGLADGIRGLPSSPEIENFGIVSVNLTGDNSKVNINYKGVTEASNLQNSFQVKVNGVNHTIDSEIIINSLGSNDSVNFMDLKCWKDVTNQIPDSIKVINGIHYTVYFNHDALVLVNDPHAGPAVKVGPLILAEEDFLATFSLHLTAGVTVSSFTYTDRGGHSVTDNFTGSTPHTYIAAHGTLTVNPVTGFATYNTLESEAGILPSDSFTYTTTDHIMHTFMVNNVPDVATLATLIGAPSKGQPLTLDLIATADGGQRISSLPNITDAGAALQLNKLPNGEFQLVVSSYNPGSTLSNTNGDHFSFKIIQGEGFSTPVSVQFGNDSQSNTTILTGTAESDILVSGLNPHGFSELIGGGGYDNLIAVAGTTTFVVEDNVFASVQGVADGKNTLVWDALGDLNIGNIRAQGTTIKNIDTINLSSDLGAGASLKATHDLFLNATDVLNITHQSTSNPNFHTLFVNGTSLDTVDLRGGPTGFSQSHHDTHPGYVDYTNSTNTLHVEVATGVHVHII